MNTEDSPNLWFRFRRLFGYFFSMDLRSLALYRVGLACVLLWDLLVRCRDLSAHYTDVGILPRQLAMEKLQYPLSFSLHMFSGHWLFQGFLFGLAFLAALALLVGYRTRLVAILSWVLLLSVQVRNPLLLNAGDSILVQSLFWAMFLPLGASFSVDRARSDLPLSKPSFSNVATFAYMMQLACLYWFSIVLKSGPAWRTEYTAVYYALSLKELVTPMGIYLRQFESILPWLTRITLWTELLAPLLFFVPFWGGRLRLLGVFALLGMHFSFQLCIDLGIFSYIPLVAVLPLLPSVFWELLGKFRASWQQALPTLFFRSDDPRAKDTLSLLCTFLLIPRSQLHPIHESESASGHAPTKAPEGEVEPVGPAASGALPLDAGLGEQEVGSLLEGERWSLLTQDGQRLSGFEAVRHLALQMPLFWPLALVFGWPVFSQCGRFLFWAFSVLWAGLQSGRMWARWPVSRTRLPVVIQMVAAFFLALVTWSNVASIDKRYPLSPTMKKLQDMLQLDQGWIMFAPEPSKLDGWIVIPGELADGTQFDLFKAHNRHPGPHTLDWKGYSSLSQKIRNYRWSNYYLGLWNEEEGDNNKPFWPQYVRYQCARWNQRAPKDKQLVFVGVYVVVAKNLPHYKSESMGSHELWLGACPDGHRVSASTGKEKTAPTTKPAERSSAPVSRPTTRPIRVR